MKSVICVSYCKPGLGDPLTPLTPVTAHQSPRCARGPPRAGAAHGTGPHVVTANRHSLQCPESTLTHHNQQPSLHCRARRVYNVIANPNMNNVNEEYDDCRLIDVPQYRYVCILILVSMII